MKENVSIVDERFSKNLNIKIARPMSTFLDKEVNFQKSYFSDTFVLLFLRSFEIPVDFTPNKIST